MGNAWDILPQLHVLDHVRLADKRAADHSDERNCACGKYHTHHTQSTVQK